MKEILLTGGTGQVGTELQKLDWPSGIRIVAPSRTILDLTDTAALTRFVASRPFAAVINCAAYTAVDRAETDAALAWTVNASAPAVLAAACAKAAMPMIQVSTDYVFDGEKTTRYEVHDAVGPLGVYGASKEGGEQAVRTACKRHVIVRTSWLVSSHAANFVKTMLRLGTERASLRVVDDQRGAPTSAADFAAVLAKISQRLIDDPLAPTGTYHFTNEGETTWCGFAREIFRQAADRGGPSPRVEAIATADYPTAARRPANSTLSTTAIERDFGVKPRPWQIALADILAELVR